MEVLWSIFVEVKISTRLVYNCELKNKVTKVVVKLLPRLIMWPALMESDNKNWIKSIFTDLEWDQTNYAKQLYKSLELYLLLFFEEFSHSLLLYHFGRFFHTIQRLLMHTLRQMCLNISVNTPAMSFSITGGTPVLGSMVGTACTTDW